MLGRDVLILKLVGLFEGAFQRAVGVRRKMRLHGAAARNFWQPLDSSLNLLGNSFRIGADLGQDRRHNAFTILEQRGEQMQRGYLGIAMLRREIIGALHRLLRLQGEFVPSNCHIVLPSKTLYASNHLARKKGERQACHLPSVNPSVAGVMQPVLFCRHQWSEASCWPSP